MSRASKIKEWIDNSYSTVPSARIQQLRICLAVHSYIYYELNESMVTDHKWQAWAQELIEEHAKHPEYTDDYDGYFIDWDGTTGYHLCRIPGIACLADKLMRWV